MPGSLSDYRGSCSGWCFQRVDARKSYLSGRESKIYNGFRKVLAFSERASPRWRAAQLEIGDSDRDSFQARRLRVGGRKDRAALRTFKNNIPLQPVIKKNRNLLWANRLRKSGRCLNMKQPFRVTGIGRKPCSPRVAFQLVLQHSFKLCAYCLNESRAVVSVDQLDACLVDNLFEVILIRSI